MSKPTTTAIQPPPSASVFSSSVGHEFSRLGKKDSWLLENISLYKLLGLSPLLAVSETLITAITLGVLTLLVCVSASLTAQPLEKLVRRNFPKGSSSEESNDSPWELLPPARLILFLTLTGFFTVVFDLIMQWQFYGLHREIGFYLPLIACNSALLVKLENLHCHNAGMASRLKESATTGVGFLLALVLLAFFRELLTYGALFTDWHLLSNPSLDLGSAANFLAERSDIKEDTIAGEYHFAFIGSAAGGLICLGFLLAAYNELKNKLSAKKEAAKVKEITTVERVRVTSRSQ